MDFFYKRGVLHPIIDFEFCIDIHHATLIYCRQPNYEFHEHNIINQHIAALEDSELITDYERSGYSLLLLTTKPSQEDCTDINHFIWSLYISYQPLHSINRSFEYTIPRCVDTIGHFRKFNDSLSMCPIDDRSEYFQLSIIGRKTKKISIYSFNNRYYSLFERNIVPLNEYIIHSIMHIFRS